MSPCFYLLFSERGELAGLEQLRPTDGLDARRMAARLLRADPDAASVEIWRGGRLIGSVRASA